MANDVFISYRRGDAAIANWLRDCLRVVGIECWLDTEIAAGTQWDREITKMIRQSRLMLVIISKLTEEDPRQIRRELVLADNFRVPVVPLRVDNTNLECCAYFLAATQALDISAKPKEQHARKVMEEVQRLLARDEPEAEYQVAPDPPPKAAAVAPAAVAPAAGKRVSLLYKRNAQPDEELLHYIEAQLTTRGYSIFHDRHLQMGVEWFREIDRKMKESYAIIPLLSVGSVESEMLSMELRTASEARQTQEGRPMILPVRVKFNGTLPQEMATALDQLQYFLWESEEHNETLINELVRALENPVEARKQFDAASLALPTGAVPLDSPFYICRDCDDGMQRAVSSRESIVHVRGARQMGKTSLIARGLNQARKANSRVVVTDLQKLNLSHLETLDTFYRALAGMMANQLKLPKPSESWDPENGPNSNLEHYVEDVALAADERPIVWALDEVDRLSDRSYSSEFFGLLRTWHNDRANDPERRWASLTVLIGFATEPSLFISDMNMSPFNVGRQLTLRDFTDEQLEDLNQRYNSPLRSAADIKNFRELLGGQPYLSRRALHEMVINNLDYARMAATADSNEGIFGDHLRRFYVLLQKDPGMLEAMRQFLKGKNVLSEAVFRRLRSGGLLRGESRDGATLRCGIYESYLKRHILD